MLRLKECLRVPDSINIARMQTSTLLEKHESKMIRITDPLKFNFTGAYLHKKIQNIYYILRVEIISELSITEQAVSHWLE